MTRVSAEPRRLGALFLGHQETLKAELVQARSGIGHSTFKGDISEGSWRQMLERHLPRRYRVCRGVVVDSEGTESDAIDVIVHDAHFCPLLLDRDGTSFVPAESVYAVFEAKQSLTAREIEYAGEKANSVRRLHRTSAPIVDCGKLRPARPVPRILAGVLALEAEWKDGLGTSLERAIGSLTEGQRLDLGCAVSVGAFECGPAGVLTIYPSEVALVSFFLRLLDRLQRLGTVPAVDWQLYGKGLGL